jgi:hypothetical protein
VSVDRTSLSFGIKTSQSTLTYAEILRAWLASRSDSTRRYARPHAPALHDRAPTTLPSARGPIRRASPGVVGVRRGDGEHLAALGPDHLPAALVHQPMMAMAEQD